MSEEIVQGKVELDVTQYLNNIDKSLQKLVEYQDKNESVNKNVREEQDKTKKNTSELTEKFKMLVKSFVGFEALRIIKNLFVDANKEFEDATRNVNALNQALKTTGQYSENYSLKLQEQASTLQKLTGIEDDEILTGQRMLLTFTNIGQNALPDATKAALDMSVAMGQDMQSSAIQLGKALNNPVEGLTALSRIGVSFNETQKETIKRFMEQGDILSAQKIILEEVNKEFGGMAESMKRPIDDLSNSWKQFLEVVGEKTKPAFDAAMEILKTAVDFYTEKLSSPTTDKILDTKLKKLEEVNKKIDEYNEKYDRYYKNNMIGMIDVREIMSLESQKKALIKEIANLKISQKKYTENPEISGLGKGEVRTTQYKAPKTKEQIEAEKKVADEAEKQRRENLAEAEKNRIEQNEILKKQMKEEKENREKLDKEEKENREKKNDELMKINSENYISNKEASDNYYRDIEKAKTENDLKIANLEYESAIKRNEIEQEFALKKIGINDEMQLAELTAAENTEKLKIDLALDSAKEIIKVEEDKIKKRKELNEEERKQQREADEARLKDSEARLKDSEENLKQEMRQAESIADKRTKQAKAYVDREKKDNRSLISSQESMKKAKENSLKDIYNLQTSLLEDTLTGEWKGLSEYGKIITQQIQMEYAATAAKAGIGSLWHFALGLGDVAAAMMGNPNAAAAATTEFQTAGEMAAIAATAGATSFVAGAAGRGMGGGGGTEATSETVINATTQQKAIKESLTNEKRVYITEADYFKSVRNGLNPALQKVVEEGGSFYVKS